MAVISGIVRDERGEPVEGARVYVADGPGPVPDIALITGPDGRFTLGAPVPGRYTVEASVEGRDAVRATLEAAKSTEDFELRFAPPRRG